MSPLIWLLIVVVVFLICRHEWRRSVNTKHMAAAAAELRADREPHVVRMADGRYAIRKYEDGYYRLYGRNYWWPQGMDLTVTKSFVVFDDTPESVWATYAREVAEQEDILARINDVGVRVDFRND